MKARERLIEAAKFQDSIAKVSTAAALRELDQILADLANFYKNYGATQREFEFSKRLSQAGYGEK